MPEIRPFPAIRFDHTRYAGDLSAVLAPPYDVLNQADKDALLAKSDHNIVAIDLPHIPPKTLGPSKAYEQSAAAMTDWLDRGILVREDAPALYLYHQLFEHAGTSYTRRKFIARVRLHPFSDNVILPHEQTFGGPKEDRLALMKTTKCNLSPVFVLYADPKNQIGKAFSEVAAQAPDVAASLNGIDNRMWIAKDAAVIDTVTKLMADKNLYIADGHHRYGTALNYRDWYAKERGGSLPDDHPVNYVMLVLASMDDPGCLILPYHRALAEIKLATVLDAWSAGTESCKREDADIVLVEGATGTEVPLRFTGRNKLKALEPDHCKPWYDLDAAYLHRYLIDELLKRKLEAEPQVRYVKSEEMARKTAREQSGVALLVNATPMSHLRAISEAGGLMPQKSTYFYPKLATGLTINPLE
ncbi:MAG: DUF1015 domain-containing protein [Planctomycetes bacterium]|nr:DUF1015 domain-containing protein [Planctomycetota bacterium]